MKRFFIFIFIIIFSFPSFSQERTWRDRRKDMLEFGMSETFDDLFLMKELMDSLYHGYPLKEEKESRDIYELFYEEVFLFVELHFSKNDSLKESFWERYKKEGEKYSDFFPFYFPEEERLLKMIDERISFTERKINRLKRFKKEVEKRKF